MSQGNAIVWAATRRAKLAPKNAGLRPTCCAMVWKRTSATRRLYKSAAYNP